MRSAVAQHLRLLSSATRHVVSVGSVLGREFSVTELALLTGKTASDLLPAVQETLRLEVLGERNEALFSATTSSARLSTRTCPHRRGWLFTARPPRPCDLLARPLCGQRASSPSVPAGGTPLAFLEACRATHPGLEGAFLVRLEDRDWRDIAVWEDSAGIRNGDKAYLR
jgi:hypothetical protein